MTVGALFGMGCSYLLKKARSITKSVVSECTVLFAFAYLAYVSAELMALSGIISLLVCSIVQKEFAWLNCSLQGKQCSVGIFEFLGLLAQGFVFSYLGLTFFFYKNYQWSA
jgi:NhaP-type Na+/H+ or K+/H+ antiporter